MINIINKEFCIKELKRLNNEYGKVTNEILKKYGNVSSDTITRLFGSLKNGYLEAGISLNKGQRKMVSKEEIISEILRINLKFGYVSKPLFEKYSTYSPKIIQRIFGSFTNMYKELNISSHSSGRIPSNKELIDECKRIFDEHKYLSYELIDKYSSISSTCFKDRAKKNNWNGINHYRKQVGCKIPELEWGESLSSKCAIEKFTIALNEKPIKEMKFDWLINPNNNRHLRIDAYYPKNNIAIEYNGPQHYFVDGHYTMSEKDLINRKKLDNLKYDLIKENGIKLIVIRYSDKITKEYIQNKINT